MEVTVFLLLFLHIAAMFLAVAASGGLLVLSLLASRSRRWGTVVAINDLRSDRLIAPLFVVGGVFGLLTAIAFGYALLAPWLVIAYVLFAAISVHGAAVAGRTTSALAPQLAAAGAGAADPALVRQFDRAFAADFAFNIVVLGLLVADMVFKPFL